MITWRMFVAMALCLSAAPLEADAQQADKVARIAVLCQVRCEGPQFDALRDGLRNAGWIEGRNLTLESRGADARLDRLPALARELIASKPDVVVAYAPNPTRAVMDATSSIPVVMLAVADPVRLGFVESLARPGGNVTGMATFVPGGFFAKQLELLKQAVPQATRIAVLFNPTNVLQPNPQELPAAARQLDVRLQMLEARTVDEIGQSLDAAVRERADALLVLGDPLFHNPAQRMPDFVARTRLPAMYLLRSISEAGGLMAYGPDFLELSRRGAAYIDKLLKGAKPADLPVEQPTKFELVINLKTAKALGLTIPQSLLLRADEVIQ
jgi:putative ABC transport system substrate-binding protein